MLNQPAIDNSAYTTSENPLMLSSDPDATEMPRYYKVTYNPRISRCPQNMRTTVLDFKASDGGI